MFLLAYSQIKIESFKYKYMDGLILRTSIPQVLHIDDQFLHSYGGAAFRPVPWPKCYAGISKLSISRAKNKRRDW